MPSSCVHLPARCMQVVKNCAHISCILYCRAWNIVHVSLQIVLENAWFVVHFPASCIVRPPHVVDICLHLVNVSYASFYFGAVVVYAVSCSSWRVLIRFPYFRTVAGHVCVLLILMSPRVARHDASHRVTRTSSPSGPHLVCVCIYIYIML